MACLCSANILRLGANAMRLEYECKMIGYESLATGVRVLNDWIRVRVRVRVRPKYECHTSGVKIYTTRVRLGKEYYATTWIRYLAWVIAWV